MKTTLTDFNKQELINVEFVNRFYSEKEKLVRMNKDELISCILNDIYCFNGSENLEYGSEDQIVDHILKYKLYE